MAEIKIEQALYGAAHGGHSLLASSGDDAVAKAVAQRLDLPDAAPPGAEWSPFLRGFPYQNRYVLSRTFLDTAASRGGMVFSHALLAPLDELVQIQNLQPLSRLLCTSDVQRPDVTTVLLTCTQSPAPRAVDLVDAAEALATKAKLPVVRLGHIGFDDLVVALWANLPPETRRGFAFRLSFGPSDLIEQPMPTLVCTPIGTAGCWPEHPVIRSATHREPASLAAAILSGYAKATPLIEFMQEMGVRPATISDLRLAEKSYELDIREHSLDRRAGVIRLIEKLSPDPSSGIAGKKRLAQMLCDVLSGAKAEEILRLRNLQLSAFPNPDRVWETLRIWMAENDYAQGQDAEMLSILEDATTSDAAVKEWKSAILSGLVAAALSTKSSFPRAFWRLTRMRPEIVDAVFPHVPAEPAVETRLAGVTPRTLGKGASAALVPLALSRNWLRFHGTVLSASAAPCDAAHRQTVVDTDPSFLEGLRAALRHAKPAEIVKCALEIEEPRMALLAGETVAENPKLLAGIDLTLATAQAIWRDALAIQPDSWQGPFDPVATFHSILDHLLGGGNTDPMLLERLSDTPLGDLCEYPRRTEIWARIEGGARHKLLTRTASGWLRSAARGHVTVLSEQELQTAVLKADELAQTLDALIPARAGTVVQIVSALSRYDQEQFIQLLRALMRRSTSLANADAESIGCLVLQRQWKDVAGYLLDRLKSGRQDIKPALRACRDMVNLLDRFVYGLALITETEKWEALQDLAADLYPGGPDDDGLWERAGGHDADLSTDGDGRMRWRNALRKVRNGKDPSPSALLARMREDFSHNEEISRLASDPVFADAVLVDPRPS